MNSKTSSRIFLIFIFISMFFYQNSWVKPVQAQEPDNVYTEQFNLDQGGTRFVMTYLGENDNWYINCTAVFKGKFHLFLFDTRPEEKHQSDDGILKDSIYNDAISYNNSPSEIFSKSLNDTVYSTTLNYTSPNEIEGETNTTLYYLQIVCVEGGPDTYILKSYGHEIQPYYIPFIPGFPFEIISLIIVSGFIILYQSIKKKL